MEQYFCYFVIVLFAMNNIKSAFVTLFISAILFDIISYYAHRTKMALMQSAYNAEPDQPALFSL